MRHADHGDVLLCELDHDVEDLLDHLGIESGGRLVEQDDRLLGAQRAGDGDALLLAAGEVLGKLAGLVRQADALERDHGGLSRLLLGLRGGRLVEQDDRLLGAQRAGDGDALLLAAGEVLGKLAGLVRQADALERDHGGLSRLLLGLLLQLDGCEREVAEHRHIGIQVELLEHHGTG